MLVNQSLVRWSHTHNLVHVMTFPLDVVGSSLPLTVDTYDGADHVRSESAPLHKLKHALINPQGRYKLTAGHLQAACVDPGNVEALASLHAFLFPPKSHRAQVLDVALENVQGRVNRGLGLDKALQDVSDLYGVALRELEEIYAESYA